MPWLGWGKNNLGGYPTLGEVLGQRGYRSGAFSANRIYFTRNVGLGRGFVHFEDYFDSVGDSFVRTLYGREFARIYLNRTEKSKATRALRYLGLESWLDKDSEGSGESEGWGEAVSQGCADWLSDAVGRLVDATRWTNGIAGAAVAITAAKRKPPRMR